MIREEGICEQASARQENVAGCRLDLCRLQLVNITIGQGNLKKIRSCMTSTRNGGIIRN